MNYTATQIAIALGKSERAIQKRATRESWPSQKRKGKGGGKVFLLSCLPEDVRAALVAEVARGSVAADECSALELSTSAPLAKRSLAPAPKVAKQITLDIPRKKKALAKADLVRLYTEALAKSLNKEQARIGFMHAYKAGAWQELYAQIGDVSWKSIERGRSSWIAPDLPTGDKRGLAKKVDCSLSEGMQLASCACPAP